VFHGTLFCCFSTTAQVCPEVVVFLCKCPHRYPPFSCAQPLESSQPSEGEVPDSDKTKVDNAENADGALKQEGEKVTDGVAKEEQQSISANAPAWTPGGIATDMVEENTPPIPVPSDDDKVATVDANIA